VTEISRPRAIGWSLILLVSMLVFGSVSLAAAPTTSASAPTFTYDVPSNARVDVRNVEGADAGPERPGLALKDSASPPSSARGTSAPRSVSFVATEGEAGVGAKGAPTPSPNFETPTSAPQDPPKQVKPGNNVRVMGPTEKYPNGYWVETNANGQPIDPSTGKPPSNVSRAGACARTHVPLPPK
jgi:hypothetical protein